MWTRTLPAVLRSAGTPQMCSPLGSSRTAPRPVARPLSPCSGPQGTPTATHQGPLAFPDQQPFWPSSHKAILRAPPLPTRARVRPSTSLHPLWVPRVTRGPFCWAFHMDAPPATQTSFLKPTLLARQLAFPNTHHLWGLEPGQSPHPHLPFPGSSPSSRINISPNQTNYCSTHTY